MKTFLNRFVGLIRNSTAIIKHRFYDKTLLLIFPISGIMVWLIIMSLIHYVGYPQGRLIDTGINLGGVIINSFLTLGLLYLYFQIVDIQEMERRPIVEVAQYGFDGNHVSIWLSNYGKGSATDLELECEIVEPEDLPISVEPRAVPLQRTDGEILRRETSIPPENEYIQYKVVPQFTVKEDRKMDWGATMKRLYKEDIEKVRFILRLHYSNQLDEKKTKMITLGPRGTDVELMSSLESHVHGIPKPEHFPESRKIDRN